MNSRPPLIIVVLLGFSAVSFAQTRISIDVSQRKGKISPTMYGIFFEDINFGADGGLYSELVKNRSFEFDRPLRGWRVMKRDGAAGDVLAIRDGSRPRNPRCARIRVDRPLGRLGLQNEGFVGMGIREGAEYRFSVEARQVQPGLSALRVEVVDRDNTLLAEGRVEGFSTRWGTYECKVKAAGTAAKARMNVWAEGVGTLDIDMVSLFPTDTWKGRKNGLRPDLVQLLADMKPGFLRFPGGCIVEGFDLSQRYQWKHTLGDPNERVQNINRWNFEFKHRPAPDYYQSYGLGYYEFFLLAEDLGAEPMPIITCGMACQFNTAELVPMDQLDPYIQDALDLIEFANGPADSQWGRIRAQMGHPAPFNMKMIGVGNEQWGPQYVERYEAFAKAIKERDPKMQLIAATGSDATIFPPPTSPSTFGNGRAEIDYLWSQWKILNPEIVDEHFYRKPEWFLENVDWYDGYDRNGPKLFVGEYASQSVGVASPDNRNLWKCALYEAAFMTGMERNADLVRMTCYAPLFGHEEAWQWRPDMIWFDNLRSYGSANYQVQKLFSLHPGTTLLSAVVTGVAQLRDKVSALNISATLDEPSGEVIIKVVNVTGSVREATVALKGAAKVGSTAKVIRLATDSLNAENTLEMPDKVSPRELSAAIPGAEFSYRFQPYSMTILRVPVQ